ncbi:hypothetical protein A2U01_0085556, partial [Trifolium medium]|nr:hypothetical protein [Trifolium medium]
RQQPQPEPQGDPEPVAADPEPKPIDVAEPDPAVAAEEDDGEQLGEADFQEPNDIVEEGVAPKKGDKLEGPSWTECIFPPADPAEF